MDDYERSESLCREAYSHFSAGEYAAAIDLYNASFDISPSPLALHGIGECYLELGKNREAIIYLSASAGLRPHPKVSFQLCQALLAGGHLDEAKRAAERAIAAMPHFKAARVLLDEIEKAIQKSRPSEGPPSTSH